MLSRTANSIYWMSRYIERADNVARFVRVSMQMLMDLGQSEDDTKWGALVYSSGDHEDFLERYKTFNEVDVVRFLTFDEKNPNSIISCIKTARENARTVREIISTEMWEALNEYYHIIEKQKRKKKIDDLHAFYMQTKMASHLFNGLAEDTMSHGEGWHFARMGRMLERADKTARLVDVKYFLLLPGLDYVDSPYDAVEWGAVLKSANAFEMYRKEHHRVNYKNATDFLLFHPHFPRSVTYCINAAAASMRFITGTLQVDVPAQTEMTKLQHMLATTEIETVLANGLHEFIDVFQFNLNVVDDAVYHSFFELK